MSKTKKTVNRPSVSRMMAERFIQSLEEFRRGYCDPDKPETWPQTHADFKEAFQATWAFKNVRRIVELLAEHHSVEDSQAMAYGVLVKAIGGRSLDFWYWIERTREEAWALVLDDFRRRFNDKAIPQSYDELRNAIAV